LRWIAKKGDRFGVAVWDIVLAEKMIRFQDGLLKIRDKGNEAHDPQTDPMRVGPPPQNIFGPWRP